MNQEIDFSTLTWVKKELDETLKQARQSLEAHVDNPQDDAQLGFLAAHLHQVYGTLQMVELYGASLLAEEMEQVARAIAAKTVTRNDDACEVLMRAILQLPDYLDRLIAGYRDIPLVLLPILNDLRAVRGETLLSETHMFSPDLNAALPESVANRRNDGDIQARAKELRHRFQLGLLAWFKGQDPQQAMTPLAEVLEQLVGLSSSDQLARFWWVSAGLADALKTGKLKSSVAINRLMGQVDRHIKSVVDDGEAALAQNVSEDLLKNLLFYVAQVRDAGPRVAAIQETYRLTDLLPGEEELAAARESLAGQNADLFETVAVAVKEELARLKDSLDIVLRSGCTNAEELQPLIVSLRSLGDTLGMLSLGAPRKAVVSKAEGLQRYVDGGDTPPDAALMDVASTLLFVESSVDGMGSGRVAPDSEAAVEEQLAESEFNQVMNVVVEEAITDLVRAKDAIASFAESSSSAEALQEVPQWFNQVKGGLLLLGDTRAAALMDAVARYVDEELIRQQNQPAQQELESLADAVCGLEYYLESRKEHRMYGGSAITVAEQSVEKLGYSVETSEYSAEPGVAELPEGESVQVDEQSDTFAVESAATTDEMPLQDVGADVAEQAVEHADPDLPATGDAQETGGFAIELESQVSPPHERAPVEDIPELSRDDSVSQDTEHESDIAAQQAETQAEQIEDEDDGLAVIGDELDEEILEIFIEEAEEEIASINEQLPVWIKDHENADALATIRRSYHTLKGSGRLVGAMRIGEFAWAHENMLNRVIDGTVAISPALTGLLESACVALPELVQQIKDGTPTRQPIASLMRCADAISKGEQPPTAAAPTPEPADEVSPVSVDEAFLEPELELDQVTLPIDESVEEYNVAEDGGAGAGEAAGWTEEPAVSDGVMDSMLYEIFSTEARGHLEVVQDFLSKAADGEPIVDEPLARALHTLHGSAHMAEAGMIADLAGGLERFVKALMGASQPMPDSGCGALQESAEMIDGMLSHLPDEIVKPEGYDELLGRIRSLYESVPLPSVTETDSELLEEGLHGADGDADELQVEEVSVQELAGVSDDPYAEFDQELLEIFLEEGEGNLETSESALHRWRENRHDSEALAELQRALHTLKGGARMAELNPIGDLAHAVESLIIAIAEGRAGAGHAALDGAQHAQDRLISMLEDVREHRPVQAADSLVSELENLREQAPEEPSAVAPVDAIAIEDELHEQPADVEPLADARSGTVPQSEDPYAEADPELLEIFLEEATDILGHSEETLQSWKQSPDEKPLMAELQRELHTLKGGARMADITEIGDLAHAVESLMVKVADDEVAAGPAMFGVLEQAHDTLVTMVERVRKHQRLEAESGLVAKLEALREGKGLAEEAETTVPESAAKADEQTAEVIALEAGKVHKERRTGSRASQELVRVKAKLLDNMVNFAGEVSIYRSRLEQQVGAYRFNLIEMEQTVSRLREQLRKLEIETEAQVLYRYEKEGDSVGEDFDPLEMDRYSHMQQLSRSLVESVSDLSSIQNLLDNITRESETLLLQQSRVNTELQEGLMRTRMVPFLGLAARMRRIVRQTGQELGKKAELELSGAEGEMDRTVVDRIIAPIEHMLRNAISHGIESPDKRRAAGKPEFGTIKITLERESSDVVLRISDDGAGMHLDAIRNKAIERGLMEADSGLTDNEVLQFILETGFSTAEKVTQVAGRGVGMDVVNSEVKQLGGSLHIDSEAGKGTTFTVRLPFTLALNQALLIEVGDDTYAIPLSSIEGIVRMRREDLKAYYDDPEARFDYGGFQYEVRHLGSVLGTGKPYLDSGPKRIPVLLARIGDHCVAFQVENLLGSREIVVKSVGPQISTVRGVSGATILGDGRVVMILDVAAMLRSGLSHAMAQVEDMIHQPVQTEGLTVMVVDDSITVRKVTTRLLERNDMNVIAAKDGVDAVSKLQERIPDIMLLDIEMPRMDGFELATHVRNEARLRHIPIIMITSRTGDKHRQRAMQIGVNRYLGKPFQEAELLENIQALLEDKNVNA